MFVIILFMIIFNTIAIIIVQILHLMDFFKKFRQKEILEKEEEEKKDNIDKILDKFIFDEDIQAIKEKFSEVSKLVKKTEVEIDEKVAKKIKVAKSHYRARHKETKQIKKGEKLYESYDSKLQSAMPRTEDERLLDMKELKKAISILESYDKKLNETVPIRRDPGIGIFYEKMARKFKLIIEENKLYKYVVIPVQRLKYYAFNTIPNLKDDDVFPILNIMKETKLLNDIIEINPTYYVIKLSDVDLKLSLAEKVVLSLASDEDLDKQRLTKLTEWNEGYANNVLKGLIEKGILTVFDNKIIVGGFGQASDRDLWNNIINDKIQKDQEKELEKAKKQLKMKEKLKAKLSAVENTEIIDRKQKNKGNKASKKDNKLKEAQKIKDKDALIGAMEALDEIIPKEYESKRESDLENQNDLKNYISERILNYHEKFSVLNGGFSQYEHIKEYVLKDIDNASDNDIKATLLQLKEYQMILDYISIGKYEFYLFKDLKFSGDELELIKFALDKKPMAKENYIKGLNWDEDKILEIMKKLQEKGILRIKKNKIVIPGLLIKD